MRFSILWRRIKLAHLALAAAALVAAFMLVYYAGFSAGFQAAYKRAYDEIYMETWGSSYMRGFSDGNTTGFKDGYKAGYEAGFKDGYGRGASDAVGRSYTLRDPASLELEEFLKDDETETLKWNPEGYSPLELAAKLKESAAKAGFRCGIAVVYHEAGIMILNCFNTTDKGIIYIEPWSDRTMMLKPGEYYMQWRILKITIVW